MRRARWLAVTVHIDRQWTAARADHNLTGSIPHSLQRASTMGCQSDRQDQEQGQI